MPSRTASDADAYEVKHLVSRKVLQVRGVSGVGTREGRLTVYLEYDSVELKEEITTVVESVAPGCSLEFVVTGKLSKQR